MAFMAERRMTAPYRSAPRTHESGTFGAPAMTTDRPPCRREAPVGQARDGDRSALAQHPHVVLLEDDLGGGAD
jgi:hypothetical protein